MELIIGGAYQGKRAYAMKKYGFSEKDIFTCTEDALPDFSAGCVDKVGNFALYCVRNGLQGRDVLEENRKKWEKTVFICEDMFCGVVPMEAENRAWRQETGLICQYLSANAQTVTRIFCGLEQRLK